MRRISALFAAICLLLTAPEASAQERLLPGTLDLPLIEGTSIPPECRWFQPPEDPTRSACVTVPARVALAAQNGYTHLLIQSGWEFVSGAANAFWFNRAIPNSDCVDRLYLVGWYDVDPAELETLNREGRLGEVDSYVFFFLMRAAPLCGDQRSSS